MSSIVGVAVAGVVLLACVGIWWYRRTRAEQPTRMTSLVALLREPMEIDITVLAKTAGRAWHADLGDGSAEGEDGFAVGGGAINTILHDNRPYLVNCLPRPYVDDIDAVCETIVDLRVRELFCEHKAWVSFDSMSIDESSTPEEITAEYGKLAKLLEEFLDENCLLIFVPEAQHAYPINEETRRALQSDDPLAALRDTSTAPVVGISPDDPQMIEAEAQARERWPEFAAAFEASAGEHFIVKAPVTHGECVEFIWLEVTAIEGEQVYGTLANEPANLGPLRLGSKVKVAAADVNDWLYVDDAGNAQGGFTLAVIAKAMEGNK